jgi:osmotically-inducible protein OsmY
MSDKERVLKSVRAAYEREARINLHRDLIKIDLAEDGALILEGEVHNIAAKKMALSLAITIPGIIGIVDRLHLKPAERMEEGMILDRVCNALIEEPAFQNCTIRLRKKGNLETVRVSANKHHGEIELFVKEGVVFLENVVSNLTLKRMAEVFAWWVPGTRDVINELEVFPPEQDNDGEITDALRIVLEKDPFLDPAQIRVATKGGIVTLEGLVKTEVQKEMAENDAWYIFGVDMVVNHLSVRGGGRRFH